MQINIYYTAANLGTVGVEDMGLLVWNSARPNGTIDDARDVIPGAVANSDGTYTVHTLGIPAKNMGDALYFKIYARLADGSYAYSTMFSTSVKAYATNLASRSTNVKEKALAVALLDYGAAAQTHFGYKPYDLMNAGLTEEQKALVSAYDPDMVAGIVRADSTKTGNFVYTSSAFSGRYPSVSFGGAFAINYYFTPALPVDGEMTLYYWRYNDYLKAGVLTTNNATGYVVMTPNSTGTYEGVLTGIAAKELDQTVYVTGVYTSGGVTYTTGVIAYSLAAYCADWINKGTGTMKPLATQAAVYGYYAKQYFAG